MSDQPFSDNSNDNDDNSTASNRDSAYFAYYGQYTHQQNMLSDLIRTKCYQNVILKAFRTSSFQDRVVLDLGAGSGILSFFACQAGASTVFALEASQMATKLRYFIEKSRNTDWLFRNGGDTPTLQVVEGKVEDLIRSGGGPIPKHSIDCLVSEPIGVLLVHERMLESFIKARDFYLKPVGGSIFPTTGTIHLCPFSDHQLWLETSNKSRWWLNQDFFGIDFSPNYEHARRELFSTVFVGGFSPAILLAHSSTPSSSLTLDFRTITTDELQDLSIPLSWVCGYTSVLHGLAGWFDCLFTNEEDEHAIKLSTHPTHPQTHWQQVRFLFEHPLAINKNDLVVGWMRLRTNSMRSYTIHAEIWIEDRSSSSDQSLQQVRDNSVRRGYWELSQQEYYYSYHGYQNSSSTFSQLNSPQMTESQQQQQQEYLGIYQ